MADAVDATLISGLRPARQASRFARDGSLAGASVGAGRGVVLRLRGA